MDEQKPEGRNVGLSAGLEPLPPPTLLHRVMPDDYRYGDVHGYTARQMREYATWCVAAEREACAKSVEPSNADYPADWTEVAKIKAECAAKIRARCGLTPEFSRRRRRSAGMTCYA